MFNVLIVDDEQLARERLKRMVAKITAYHVLGEAENGEQAVAFCRSRSPDIVLMDIRMPGMDGLVAARQISALDEAPAVIFCTAYGEYALEAFDVAAVDYLLKPVNQQKLHMALEKAQRLNKVQLNALQELHPASKEASAASADRQHLTSTHRGELLLISVDDVRLLLADQKYVTAYHCGGEALLEDSLKALEQEFSERFVRIHRNALIAVSAIEALERQGDGGYCVRLSDCTIRPQVSRRHVTALRRFLQSL